MEINENAQAAADFGAALRSACRIAAEGLGDDIAKLSCVSKDYGSSEPERVN